MGTDSLCPIDAGGDGSKLRMGECTQEEGRDSQKKKTHRMVSDACEGKLDFIPEMISS